MSDNWIVQNLNSALSTWSEKMAELWTLLTEKLSRQRMVVSVRCGYNL